jgi:hypothetical protein
MTKMPTSTSIIFYKYIEVAAQKLKVLIWDKLVHGANREQRWASELCFMFGGGILLCALCGWFVAAIIWIFVTPTFLIWRYMQHQKRMQLLGRHTFGASAEVKEP